MKSALKMFAQIIAATCVVTATAHAATQDTERLQQAWRTAIAHTPVPSQGCFNASYPLLVWHQVRCAKPAISKFSQMQDMGGSGRAGGYDDYAAVSKRLISSTVGSFPSAKHVTSVHGPGGANDYSLQLNSNKIPDANEPLCAGTTTPTYCYGWEQFVYGYLNGWVYIQDWLVFYNAPCPPGWANPLGTGDCFRDSPFVNVPQQALSELPYLSITGKATTRFGDTVVMTTRTQAYSSSQADVLALATNWHTSEFNILSGGCDTAGCDPTAYFNSGASVVVKVALSNRAAQKPACASDAGTSAEENNMVLARCVTVPGVGGALPYIKFTETAP
jgi:hypothetical protein